MTNNAIITLNSGVFTPKIDVRSDHEKYAGGCRILENMFPKIYGCVERRTGSEYLVFAYDSIAVLLYIVAVDNVGLCYENEIVTTVYGGLAHDVMCYENDILCYENEVVMDGDYDVSGVVCYENNVVFYENNLVAA